MLKKYGTLFEKYPFLLRWSMNEKVMYIDKPDASKILTLAPHPDDDVLGCGGTLALYSEREHHTTVLSLTCSELERHKELLKASFH